MPTELFRSRDLLVRADMVEPAGKVVVTFDCHTGVHRLDRKGYGERFFQKRRINAIHVISRDNRWYQYEEMPAALAAIRRETDRCARVCTYGSSMGGYAAIRFAAQLGAELALTIAPQYSIDPRVCSHDDRWPEAGWVEFCVENEQPIAPIPRCIAVYDPHDRQDRRHVELIAAEQPVTSVRIPYAGHSAGSYLSETGLLTEMVSTVIDGDFDAREFETRARSMRRQAAKYHEALSYHAEKRHLGWALSLAKRSADLNSRNAYYANRVACLLEKAGDIGDAAYWQRKAVRMQPDNTFFILDLSRILLRTDAFRETIPLLEPIIDAEPRNADAHHFLAEARFRDGDLASAAIAGREALRLNPRHLWYVNAMERYTEALLLWQSRLVKAWMPD